MPIRQILLTIIAAMLLTACTPLIDASSPTSATPAPSAAEEPETQALELGEFDPEGDFELFDPCTEIPGKTLEAAGLGEQILDPHYDRDRSAMCSYKTTLSRDFPGSVTLTGDRNPKSRIEELGFMLEEATQSQIPDIYLHQMGGDITDHCGAAVHTSRGRFIVLYDEISTERTRNELCVIAVEHLETIYKNLGENNGDFHRQ